MGRYWVTYTIVDDYNGGCGSGAADMDLNHLPANGDDVAMLSQRITAIQHGNGSLSSRMRVLVQAWSRMAG